MLFGVAFTLISQSMVYVSDENLLIIDLEQRASRLEGFHCSTSMVSLASHQHLLT